MTSQKIRFFKAKNGYFLNIGQNIRLSWMPRTMTINQVGYLHCHWWTWNDKTRYFSDRRGFSKMYGAPK